ncbi:hypothetical protein MSAN_00726400 [Mycena sanguinolenta]|uniref:Uncharacterized protein n=1 Tax=Mycena sanguinolenta TaxID=230812 RepID=A0A8H6Z823_9AGAR|nr:hypothetical protein MSAN_00726400 [Mycena sanguinolenta]
MSQVNVNWDPVLLVSQIVSMQSLHYLTLSICVPPLLNLFAEPTSLNYEGGAANVGMVMDWREMAGRPTVRGMQGEERWSAYRGAWTGGRKVGYGLREDQWNGRIDSMRGWVIAFCWLVACSADVYYLYALIRRPRLILDFALTLVFNHLVLTTYYSASIPTSAREMAEGLQVVTQSNDDEAEELEMGLLPRNSGALDFFFNLHHALLHA